MFILKRSTNASSLYIRIGKNIAFLRKQRNLNQDTLGSEMHISQSTISQYETGKKKLSIETLIKFGAFFNVPLQELMFENFENADENDVYDYNSKRELAPIKKCANHTYYCYYIKEKYDRQKGLIKQISCVEIRIFSPETANSANASLKFAEKDNNCPASLHIDGKYAYIVSHEFSRDFFFHLTFCYYRDASRVSYAGGIGLMQKLDSNMLPISQYCIISLNAISEKKWYKLIPLLEIKDDPNFQLNGGNLSKCKFSSSTVIRLTSDLDKVVFEWLQKNIRIK